MRMDAGVRKNQVILHHNATSQWLLFKNPRQIVEAYRIEEIIPALRQIEENVCATGWYAAGFISYEASCAFDPALCTKIPGDFPLLWFGLFPPPDTIGLPDPDFEVFTVGEKTPSVCREEYNQAISSIKEHIHSGDTYQVNYTLQLSMPFSGDPWNLFLSMVRAQSPGYAAWLDTGRYSICSASPELFFRVDGKTLTCKPMKGTVRRGRTLREDESLSTWLNQSEKNRAENLMIVDMIRNDLGRIAVPGSVRVEKLFEVERHPTLWQMTSTIRADSTNSFTEIFTALFPCASITGAPKIRTTHIINKLEKTPRNVYTGCIGFMAPDRQAQFNVAIRTGIVDRLKHTVEYGTGGGIVWDSESKDEYTEAILKSRVLTEQRPDFSLLETILWTRDNGYFLLDLHLKRLIDSAEYFGFQVQLEIVTKLLQLECAGFSEKSYKVRLLADSTGEVDIQPTPIALEDSQEKIRVRVAEAPVDSKNIFLYHKTTYRSVYDDALYRVPDCDDVLLWNERGELTESSIANIVVEIDGILQTPPVSSGILPGVFRQFLLEQGKILEKPLSISDLKNCRKIYLINSVRKWREAMLVDA